MSKTADVNDAYREIVWPEKPDLRDLEVWENNRRAVALLCSAGTVTEWLDGERGKDTYIHMAYQYEVDGLKVEFLPHWGFYTVGGINLSPPTSEQDVRNDVRAVKQLKGAVNLGQEFQSTVEDVKRQAVEYLVGRGYKRG